MNPVTSENLDLLELWDLRERKVTQDLREWQESRAVEGLPEPE